MSRQAYIPEENLFGVKTVVTDKSVKGLPSDMSREQETNLPPGAATPKTVRQPDTADGNGRVLAENGPSYNTPGTNEPGPFEHPRTLGVPGEQEGSPTKFDYGMPTRRTMTGADKEAYKPRVPWRRQRRQRVWDKLESKRDYQQNKSKIKQRAKLWYKRVRKNRQFLTKKENRRENPQKYQRRRVGGSEDEMMHAAYTPTSLSTRRHRQHGPARMKSHRNYIRNRAKAHRRQHIWYQRNKNKPAFKRRQTMRRQHPQRFRLRPGAYVPGPGIGFVYGPSMTLGQVDSVSADAVVFSPVMGGDPLNPLVLTPAAFLHAVVFDSSESMRMMFAVLDDQVGLTAYDDLTVEDVADIADQYGVASLELVSDNPDYLSSVASQIVGEAMDAWDDPSPMAVRLATRHLEALGEILLYDQGRPTSHDQAKMVTRDPYNQDHEPTPGLEKPEESGESAPASSGKVIPDSMKFASHWQEEREDDDHYYFLKTPDGNYIFRYFTTWEGEEKSTGNLVWTGGEFGEENIGEFTLDEAKRRADKHYQAFRAEKAAEVVAEKKERTLREQLLDFAADFREGTGDYKLRYEMLIQQAFALGMIDENLRKKLNRHNKQVSSLKSGPVSANELMAQGLEMIVRDSKHELLRTAATIADIEKHVAADVAKRARSVKVRLSRADPSNGIWTFQATGSKGKAYTIRVKAEAKGNVKEVAKAQLRVSCDCDFFRFQGPEHWARTNGYLYGKPRGTAAAPTEKDAAGKHWLCKHIYAALSVSRHYRIAHYNYPWRDEGVEVVPWDYEMVRRIARKALTRS